MQSSPAWKWLALAATGLLVVAGALVACTATSGCHGGTLSREEAPASTSALGEKNMSVTHVKPQVQHANDANFRNLVLNADVPVLVDFYADWCGPCQRLAPVLEELAAETPEARIVKVNVDHSPSLAAEYGVDSIPSIKVFKNGAVTDQLVGLVSKGRLRSLLVR
jgi:thioredoxin 1